MSNELAVQVDDLDLDAYLPAVRPVSEVAESGEEFAGFLPNLTLVQGTSPLAYAPHNLPQGTIVLKKGQNVTSLEKAFDGVMLDWRWRAVDFSSDPVRVAFDQHSPIFQEIKEISDSGAKDAQGRPLAQWGFEFLTYVGDVGEYALLYCNTVSSRFSANETLFSKLRQPVTIYSDDSEVKGKRFKVWKAKLSQMQMTIPYTNPEAAKQVMRFQAAAKTAEVVEASTEL